MKTLKVFLLVLTMAVGAVAGDLANVADRGRETAAKLLAMAGVADRGGAKGERDEARGHGEGHEDEDEHGHDEVHKEEDEHGDGKGPGRTGEWDRPGRHDEPGTTMRLAPGQIELAEIRTAPVALDVQRIVTSHAGEVRMNGDRLVSVVPRVAGVVRSVNSFLGDRVETGTVMVVVDSRALADAKSEFMVVRERARSARTKLEREERLWKKKITSEEAYLDARAALAEARIQVRAARQKLLALGLAADEVESVASKAGEPFTRYEVTAPFAGTVIEKRITVGASVHEENPIYRIANLESVWIIASVYEKDISRIERGREATVATNAYPGRTFRGQVTWISETVDEETRTLEVRIEVDNAHRLLKPGMFVRVGIVVSSRENVLLVDDSALRRHRGEDVVFVAEGVGRFVRREVTLGERSEERVEVTSGLTAGERVVVTGSFLLKSELEKESFEAGHAH